MTRRPGRPALPASQRRSKSIRVPLSPAEHAAIAEFARRTGEDVSVIMRTLTLKKAARAGFRPKAYS